MNILLTGGNGYVGKALCQELLTRDYHLTCAYRKTLYESRQQVECSGFRRTVVGNIDADTQWAPSLKHIDLVVHLAGLAHFPDRTGYRRFFSVNHEGTRNLAIQAARQGVKRFLFMSSILVNGSASTEGPFCEADSPRPQNVYAASKLAAEKSLQKIGANTGMEVVILRPPLVYGPGVKANFLKLLELVYTGVPMPFKAVSNRRSFISIRNLVDAVCLCISHEKAANQTFVISDCQDFSTPRLIATIAAAMGRPARLFPVPETLMKTGLSLLGRKSVYDRLWGTLQVDSSRIRTRLGWNPSISVVRGMDETVHWYLNNRRDHNRVQV